MKTPSRNRKGKPHNLPSQHGLPKPFSRVTTRELDKVQYESNTVSAQQKKANKALKAAKDLELDRLNSGKWHYVDGHKGKRLVKI